MLDIEKDLIYFELKRDTNCVTQFVFLEAKIVENIKSVLKIFDNMK